MGLVRSDSSRTGLVMGDSESTWTNPPVEALSSVIESVLDPPPIRAARPLGVPDQVLDRHVPPRSSACDSEELPASSHTLELVLTAVSELDAGTYYEVGDSARNQHLARRGES